MTPRIFVDSGNYFSNNDNFGDRAVYQSIVQRLRALWPQCELRWLTRNAELLRACCPEVAPLQLDGDRQPLGSQGQTLGLKESDRDQRRILDTLNACDLVLATGGGYFSDSFAGHAWTILDTLEVAARLGKPTAILGCGFEPIRDRSLSEKMLRVLPQVSLVACREPLQSPAVARSFGVDPERVVVTGDDAIAIAYALRPEALGAGLGINLRQADYSGVDSGTLERLRGGLQAAAGRLAAPFVRVPISMCGPSDPEAIRAVLSGSVGGLDDSGVLATAEDVVRQAGRCRLVITGSYHAAVFALSQGVSVVALAASSHYRAKLHGLRAQFGSACRVVELERDDTSERLAAAIFEGWAEADRVRPELLQAAQAQMEASVAAYQRVRDLLPAARHAVDSPRLQAHAQQAARTSPELRGPHPFRLSSAEIDTFRRQGFVGPFTAFDPLEMQRVRQIIHDRVLTTPTPYCPFGLRVRHLDSRTVLELCSAPAIVGRMQSLFGPDLVLWNSNLFNKPPAEPSRPEEYPWHQDHYNWNIEPVLNVSAWLAIGPATLENGCVEVIPGSHREIVPPVKDTDPRLSLRFGGVASDPAYVDESKKVSLPLAPGQFFLFNERLLHHSRPNRTAEPRLGLAVRVTVPLVKVSEPFPCLLLSGEDKLGFNRYADAPTDEPDAEWLAALPAAHAFQFDRPIPGMGWYLRESDGERHFAWTGLEPEAWIEFRPVGRGDHVLRCEIVHTLSSKALETLQVHVNGERVRLEQRPAGTAVVVEAQVPERILQLRSDRVRVVLRVPELTRPCDVNPASPDKRALGVGVGSISLTPAGAGDPASKLDDTRGTPPGALPRVRRLLSQLASFGVRPMVSLAGKLLRLCLRLARRATIFPRIGNVNHYPPRALTVCSGPPQRDQSTRKPSISIITPSLNQGAFIERTIDSVVQQGYPYLEYFVQDGGSTDRTLAVLKSCEQRLSGWRSAADRGQSHAINLGLARTRGEIMAWLNSDDLLLPGALARVADHFARHPEVDVIYGNRLLIDENDMEIGRWLLPGHDGGVLSWGDYVPQETLFWRRSIWNKVGGRVDESFRFAMDWDLLLRFRDAGACFAHLPYFLGAFRIHADQKTSAIMNSVGAEEMARIRTRIWGRIPTSAELRRALMPFLVRHMLADVVYRLRTWTGAQVSRIRPALWRAAARRQLVRDSRGAAAAGERGW